MNFEKFQLLPGVVNPTQYEKFQSFFLEVFSI